MEHGEQGILYKDPLLNLIPFPHDLMQRTSLLFITFQEIAFSSPQGS